MNTPTPITDKFSDYSEDFLPTDKVIHTDLARRLELDRAALMAIAERVANDDEVPTDGDMVVAILKRDARAALSAARANFPEL